MTSSHTASAAYFSRDSSFARHQHMTGTLIASAAHCSPNASFSGSPGLPRPSSSSAMQNGYAESHQMQESIWSGAVAAAGNSFSQQTRAHPSPPPLRPPEPPKPKPNLDVSLTPHTHLLPHFHFFLSPKQSCCQYASCTHRQELCRHPCRCNPVRPR